MSELASIEAVKQGIAKEYFKNVVVIDDDCYDQDDSQGTIPQKINDLYKDFHSDCQNGGILCHFQYYPKEKSGEKKDFQSDYFKPYYDSSQKLTELCDVLIIDWYLGLKESHEHSLELIKNIINKDTLKFIIIYTIHPEDACKEIENIGFNKIVKKKLNQEVETEIFNSVDNDDLEVIKNHFSKSSIYISIKTKEKISNSKEIFTEMIEMANIFSPDLLHWSGMDIFNRVRRIVPKLISKLPKDITPGLAFQSIFKENNLEVAEHISSLFIQDIEENVFHALPEILKEEYLIQELNSEIKQFFSSKSQKNKLIKRIDEMISEARVEDDFSRREYSFSDLGLNYESIIRLDSYMESYRYIDLERVIIKQGTVIELADREYLLCITPLCDLKRLKKESKISFLKGVELSKLSDTPSHNHIQTTISYEENNINILWEFSDIFVLKSDKKLNDFPTINDLNIKNGKVVGKLRQDILYRLINRLYSHRSRVGIDLFDITRRIRNEK